MRRHTLSTRNQRRASTLPLVAISSTVLVSFAAITIDLGYMRMAAVEVQNTADSAALAGAPAAQLSETLAESRALDYATRNHVAQRVVDLDALEVQTGYWSGVDNAFVAATGSETFNANAVRVTAMQKEIAFFFAPIMEQYKGDVTRSATALAGGGRCAGVWGKVEIWSHGNLIIDSYDSTEGSYGGTNVNANGDLCSCEDLRVSGSVEIHGDAMYGIGYDFTGNGSVYEVWGLIGEHPCNFPEINPDFFYAAFNNDNYRIHYDPPLKGGKNYHNYTKLSLSGQDVAYLPSGTYFFTDVKITGQAEVVINGPTEIYVYGDADFTGGGLTNTSEDPKNLKLYVTHGDVKIAGNAGFYGGVYAPDSDVDMTGTSDIYGMIIADKVEFGGTTLMHVDEALVQDMLDIDPVIPILVE